MKKIILIVLSIILITIPAWGNAAAPSQDPETNMLFFSDDTGISLVEEWITFTVDEEWDQRAQVEVKYILKNIKPFLNQKALIAFEHGYLQKEDIKKFVETYLPDAIILQKKDLQQKDRFTFIGLGGVLS